MLHFKGGSNCNGQNISKPNLYECLDTAIVRFDKFSNLEEQVDASKVKFVHVVEVTVRIGRRFRARQWARSMH